MELLQKIRSHVIDIRGRVLPYLLRVRSFVQRNNITTVRSSRAVREIVHRVGATGVAARQAWTTILEVILRLQIRIKLSLIVASAVVATTLIISTIAINLQQRESRLQTQVLGMQIVQSLTAVAEDNLLLNSVPVLQDYVKNFGKREIPGLEHLYVIDRTGAIVAHISSDSVNRQVSAADFDLLSAADSATAVETESEFRFIQGIYVSKHDGNQVRRILLGGASAGFSKAVLLAPIEEMRNKIILASFGVAVISIGFVYFISKRIVHVIIVLSDAARRVGSGDLKVTVMTKAKDEIGMLAREFNLMVLQIRQKTEMQKFVSRSTMDMLSGGNEATLGGSRKMIVAMFTDIRNFTSYSEKHWPEEVVDTLNHYLDLQTRVIHAHGGVVDKFLGDGIMSVFTGTLMAQNAIEAAIDIQKEVSELNGGRKKSGEICLQVGVGISAGVAVLGSIGSKDRMDHTAIGDTVNLASRLCGLAGPAEIYVTDDVVKRIKNAFPAKSEGTLAIKGKQQQVPVYRITYALAS